MTKRIAVTLFAVILMMLGFSQVASAQGSFRIIRKVPAPAAAPALDHNASAACAGLCSGTPQSISVSFTATAGTHIIVEGSWCNSPSCGVGTSSTDITGGGGGISNGSDTFVNKLFDTSTSTGIGYYLYEVISATGGTHTVTLTFNSSLTTVNYAILSVHSVKNLAAGDAFDAQGSATNASSANGSCPTSGNLAQSGEWVVGFMTAGNTITQGSGFTLLNTPSGANAADEYEVGGTSGSTVTATFVNPVTRWVCEVATFKHL